MKKTALFILIFFPFITLKAMEEEEEDPIVFTTQQPATYIQPSQPIISIRLLYSMQTFITKKFQQIDIRLEGLEWKIKNAETSISNLSKTITEYTQKELVNYYNQHIQAIQLAKATVNYNECILCGKDHTT